MIFSYRLCEGFGNLVFLNAAPLITFVIPAYNAAGTIASALEALLMQSSGNWEAVVVDDGSTDETGAIVDAISNNNGHIRVLHQANAGVAAARNAALQVARGDYLAFLDADDTIVSDYVEKLEGVLQEKRPDVVALSYRSIPQGSTFGYGNFEGDSIDFLELSLLNEYATFPCWLFLMSRKLVVDANISFTVGRRTGEDQEFVLKMLCRASTCLSVDSEDIYYLYRTASETSAMGSNLEGQYDYPKAMLSVIFDSVEYENCHESSKGLDVRRLLFERYVGSCTYATEVAINNGASYSDVNLWAGAAFGQINEISDKLGICLSVKNRLLLFLWTNCRPGLLRALKIKLRVQKTAHAVRDKINRFRP